MFRLTALVALLASATALKVDSPAGKSLLSKSRSLEQNDFSWMMDYSMVFQSCHRVVNYHSQNGNNNENNGNNNGEEPITYVNLVKYKLCPSDKCRYGCKGAEYVTDMNNFVDSWTEWTMNDQEYKCEQVREACGCDNYYGDEDTCYSKCFTNAGMTECIKEQADDGFVFELQEWLQCKESAALDEYGNALYVGPKCSSNGEQINLGVFKDADCTQEYSSRAFAAYYGGTSLPYQSTNIVAENCIKCKEEDGQDQYYNANYKLTEICQETYPASAKCETNLASYLSYPITSGCEFVNNIRAHEYGYKPVSSFASNFFAGLFFVSTVLLGAFAVHLHRLNSRKIKLSSNGAMV